MVQETLSHKALQRPDKIAEALRLLGVEKFWDRVAGEMNSSNKKIRSKLESIVKRRDQIVHEGDTKPRGKYSTKVRDINHKTVYEWCAFIDQLVKASDKVINDNL